MIFCTAKTDMNMLTACQAIVTRTSAPTIQAISGRASRKALHGMCLLRTAWPKGFPLNHQGDSAAEPRHKRMKKRTRTSAPFLHFTLQTAHPARGRE